MNYLIINYKNVSFCTLNPCNYFCGLIMFLANDILVSLRVFRFFFGMYREVGRSLRFIPTRFLKPRRKRYGRAFRYKSSHLLRRAVGYPLQSLTRVSLQLSVISKQFFNTCYFQFLTSNFNASQEST
ncbi:hypothetical protein HNQ90_002762 [Algibacter amylolyticus]|nr:hypothetical protein [Algibacter amylolyticus]